MKAKVGNRRNSNNILRAGLRKKLEVCSLKFVSPGGESQQGPLFIEICRPDGSVCVGFSQGGHSRPAQKVVGGSLSEHGSAPVWGYAAGEALMG
jgi:hypothetical protein